VVTIRKLQGPHPEFGHRLPSVTRAEPAPISVEVIGSVAPEEVPRLAPVRGIWTALARRAIEDHEQGRVTVVKLDTQEAAKRMRNGMSDYIRKAGYLLHPVAVDQGKDGIRVFLELRRKPEQETTG